MSSLSPGGAVDGPGEEVYQNKNVLYITTHRTPGSQNSSDMVRVLVRSLCRVSAREVPWVGLGRRSGFPKNKMLLYIFTHRTPGPQNFI